jgi:hypothetical protein
VSRRAFQALRVRDQALAAAGHQHDGELVFSLRDCEPARIDHLASHRAAHSRWVTRARPFERIVERYRHRAHRGSSPATSVPRRASNRVRRIGQRAHSRPTSPHCRRELARMTRHRAQHVRATDRRAMRRLTLACRERGLVVVLLTRRCERWIVNAMRIDSAPAHRRRRDEWLLRPPTREIFFEPDRRWIVPTLRLPFRVTFPSVRHREVTEIGSSSEERHIDHRG